MADKEIKKIVFTAEWKDEVTAKLSALESRLKKTKKTSETTSQQTDKLVSEQASRQMMAFNEKTEKGRQLLVAFGAAAGGASGALGQTAGALLYYGGTVGYVIGGVSKLHLGIMALVAGVAVLGKTIYDTATIGFDRATKGIKEMRQEINSLSESIRKAHQENVDLVADLDEWDIRRRELRQQRSEAQTRLAQLEAEIREAQKKEQPSPVAKGIKFITGIEEAQEKPSPVAKGLELITGIDVSGIERLDVLSISIKNAKEEAMRLRHDIVKLDNGLAELDEMKTFAKKTEEVRKTRAEAERLEERLRTMKPANWFGSPALWIKNTEKIAEFAKTIYKDTMTAEQKRAGIIAHFDREIYRSRETARQQDLEMLARYHEARSKMEEEENRKSYETYKIGADAILRVGQALLTSHKKGLWASLKETLQALAIESLIKAAYQTAEGIAMIAGGYTAGKAMIHFTAAAKYAAVAAAAGIGTAVASSFAGGGGGASTASASPASYTAGAETPGGERKQVTNIYVYGHQVFARGADKVFHDSVRRWGETQNPDEDMVEFGS